MSSHCRMCLLLGAAPLLYPISGSCPPLEYRRRGPFRPSPRGLGHPAGRGAAPGATDTPAAGTMEARVIDERGTDMPTEIATFGAGCFWGVEYLFRRVPGVTEAISGYSGGFVENPSYQL